MRRALFAAIAAVALPAAITVAATRLSGDRAIDPSGAGIGPQVSSGLGDESATATHADRVSPSSDLDDLRMLAVRPPRAAHAASSAGSGSGNFQLIAAAWNTGTIYDVDLATAVLSNGRATGVRQLSGLSVSPEGTLFASRAFIIDPTTLALYRIDDPVLGTATAVGPSGWENIIEGDLDFDPLSGRLLGMWSFELGGPIFLEYNPATGAATALGELTGFAGFDPSGLAFDASGDLYLFTRCPDELHMVNPFTGAALTTTRLLTPVNAVIAGMDFDPVSGLLYLATGFPDLSKPDFKPPALYEVDPVTGDVIEIGPLATDIGALVFLPVP